MTGTLTIGGNMMDVTASKTSDFYRGCRIEVDVMTNRTFPASATIGSGATADLRSVFATAGWDVTFGVDEINVPEDASSDQRRAEHPALRSRRRTGRGGLAAVALRRVVTGQPLRNHVRRRHGPAEGAAGSPMRRSAATR